jgi:hypothetical protein
MASMFRRAEYKFMAILDQVTAGDSCLGMHYTVVPLNII